MSAFGRLIPFLTVIVSLMAFYQLYTSVTIGLRGEYAFAAFYGVFALAGFALARALWINRRKFT
ncbi:MAG TPA: hypothetical protein VD758_04090 [Gemmatimonadaceae bacterium]|nr:hypothetical protein [Gemmatimonadaceae bacterium]